MINVILWTNGMVMAFRDDEQLPAWQGRHREVWPALKQAYREGGSGGGVDRMQFRIGDYQTGWSHPLRAAQFFALCGDDQAWKIAGQNPAETTRPS